MRGIAGIIHFDQAPVAPAQIRRMIDTMAICATDRVEHWAQGPAGLAYLLKETTREDGFEVQPVISSDGTAILVTDAYLTNRADLANAFGWSAVEAAGRADSAFVMAAWEKWGEECPGHLEGK